MERQVFNLDILFLITNDYLNDKKNKDEIFVPIGKTLKEVDYVIDQNDLLGINCIWQVLY